MSCPIWAQPPASGGHHKEHHHDFNDIDHWVRVFEEPGRDVWQKPEQVVAWLKATSGLTVADVGAASGYFTRTWARAVGPTGWAIAVEIEPGFFKPIHELARKEGLTNVLTQICGPEGPGLPDHSVDVIFICDTLHHIDHRVGYYEKVKAALKDGGQLAIVDYFHDKDLPFGPKKAERLDHRLIMAELEKAGFTVRLNDTLLPYQYIIDARRTKP